MAAYNIAVTLALSLGLAGAAPMVAHQLGGSCDLNTETNPPRPYDSVTQSAMIFNSFSDELATDMYFWIAVELSTLAKTVRSSKAAVEFTTALMKDRNFLRALRSLLDNTVASRAGAIGTAVDQRQAVLRALLGIDSKAAMLPSIDGACGSKDNSRCVASIAALATALDKFTKSPANPVKDKVEAGIIRDYFTICTVNIMNILFPGPDDLEGKSRNIYTNLLSFVRENIVNSLGKESEISKEAQKRYNSARDQNDRLKNMLRRFKDEEKNLPKMSQIGSYINRFYNVVINNYMDTIYRRVKANN